MIHSMGGGVIREYDSLIYVFVCLEDGFSKGEKRWYISPFSKIKIGDKVLAPDGSRTVTGVVLRVENVTAQTAPFPVKRTKEIESIL
ncbi:MAG: hypothetical protein NC131_04420 [Roseburia sp.]|nr:hypothetical protein [Roseburia sp.]